MCLLMGTGEDLARGGDGAIIRYPTTVGGRTFMRTSNFSQHTFEKLNPHSSNVYLRLGWKGLLGMGAPTGPLQERGKRRERKLEIDESESKEL